MSRITGSDAKGLMEAYSAVYAPQELTEEQVWEEVETWVNSLLEEGYDLSEYTWEEMYEAYLEEKEGIFNNDITRGISRAASGVGDYAKSLTNAQNRNSKPPSRTFKSDSGGSTGFGRYATPSAQVRTPAPAVDTGDNDGGGDRNRDRGGDGGNIPPQPKGDVIVKAAKGGVPGSLNKTTGKWTASDGGKVAPAPSTPTAAKPATGMLGKTSFERRTPTSAELKAAQAARASGASPEKALQAAKSASAPKVAPSNTLSNTVAAASKPAAFSPAPEVKATNTIAAAPKLAPVSPRQARLNMEMEYDAYDLVLEYLLSQGHAETVEEAHYVMLEMDAETIGSIVEERRDPRGRVSSGPMNVYRKPEGKPSQAHLDAVKSYDEKQKKKSPEQKEAELAAYIQRQRENK
jgi:hypothetical protein